MQRYLELNNPEKVRAILAAVLEPVSREYSLHLSQIDKSDLDVNQLEEIEKIFSSSDIEITEGENLKYRLNDNARKDLAETLDMVSVHKVIADTLMKDLKDVFGIDIT